MPTVALTVQDATVVRFTGPFEDLIARELADPTEVAFVFGTDQPGFEEVTYIYGTNPELVKDAIGEYHVDVDTTGMAPAGGQALLTGEFFSDADNTGTLQASGYAVVRVLANPMTNPFPAA